MELPKDYIGTSVADAEETKSRGQSAYETGSQVALLNLHMLLGLPAVTFWLLTAKQRLEVAYSMATTRLAAIGFTLLFVLALYPIVLLVYWLLNRCVGVHCAVCACC